MMISSFIFRHITLGGSHRGAGPNVLVTQKDSEYISANQLGTGVHHAAIKL